MRYEDQNRRHASGATHGLGAGLVALLAAMGRCADDAARLGVRYADDVGRAAFRHADDVGRPWMHSGDDLLSAADDLTIVRPVRNVERARAEYAASQLTHADDESTSFALRAFEEVIESAAELATDSDLEQE